MIAVSGLTKSYGNLRVIDDLSLSIDEGRLIAILGPSGCGKSTLLNVLSGLEKPDSGTVQNMTGGRVGYMLQDPLLLPWRTLEQNALLGLEVLDRRGAPTPSPARELLDNFGLLSASDTYPATASGGMKQRVALIRTLLLLPSVLLLDEPFANLDFDIKLRIQRFLLSHQRATGMTIIMVTHDIDDAVAMSDEVIILTGKPARVKTSVPISFGLDPRDPVEARKSPRFATYFASVWSEITNVDKS